MKIAHIADLHLGYRAYHRTTAGGVNAREADVARALRDAVGRVIEERPDIVLVAGDVFHTVRPSNTAIAEAFAQFSRLAEGVRPAPVVIIAGNHDSPRSTETVNILTLFRQIPGVEVVCERVERLSFPALDAAVLCVPDSSLVVGEISFQPDPTVATNLLVLHGTVGGDVSRQKLRYVSEHGGGTVLDTDIGPERWDYVALGHYHLLTELAPNMWYAGGLERTSTNIWMEAGPKGFLTYETEEGRANFHVVETRPMVDLPRLDARGLTPAEVDGCLADAVAAVPGGIAGKIVRQVVVNLPRVVLRGLDQAKLRDYRAEALHFQLDARTPEARVESADSAPAPRPTLEEELDGYLAKWSIGTPGVAREELRELGQHYLKTPEEGGE